MRVLAALVLVPLVVLGQSAPKSTGSSSSSSSTTPSVALTVAALPATLNETTEGTIDWFDIHTSNALRPSSNVSHSKVRGEGDMFSSFVWIKAPSGSSAIFNGDLAFPKTITGSDDIDGAGLSSYPNGSYINVSGTQTGHGFHFRAYATRAVRVLRVYMGRNATTVLCTATLTDGTTSNVSVPQATGSPTVFQLGQKVTVTYNSSTDGQYLNLECKSTTTHSAAGTVNFMAATIASS